MDLQREYLSKNHAKYLLKYHVILVTPCVIHSRG